MQDASARRFGRVVRYIADAVSRQGMKDMIERMEKAGAVRRRKRRPKKIK